MCSKYASKMNKRYAQNMPLHRLQQNMQKICKKSDEHHDAITMQKICRNYAVPAQHDNTARHFHGTMSTSYRQ